MVRHCDAAVVKPDTTLVQINPGLRFYGRYAIGHSLAPLVSATKIASHTLAPTGRPVGRLGGY